MLEIFESIVSDGELEIGTYLLCMLVACGCGTLLALASSYRSHLGRSMLLSLVLLPPVVTTVIVMVNGSIGTGLAVAGAFALVRFRSVAGKGKDIVLLFMAMAVGLICAQGYVSISILFAILCGLGIVLFTLVPLKADRELSLKITVPESLNVLDAFDDILGKYTVSKNLCSVKTTNMGSLYKMTYRIILKKDAKVKEMLDTLRTRNGNLEITLSDAEERSDEL